MRLAVDVNRVTTLGRNEDITFGSDDKLLGPQSPGASYGAPCHF